MLEPEEKTLLLDLLAKEAERLAGWLEKTGKPSTAEKIAKRKQFAEDLRRKIGG